MTAVSTCPAATHRPAASCPLSERRLAGCGIGRFLCRAVGGRRSAVLRCGPSLAAAIAALLMGAQPGLAAPAGSDGIVHLVGTDPDLTLVCPGGALVDPELQNRRTGEIVPIANPRLRAVAAKACSSGLAAAPPETQPVRIFNDRAAPVYVAYSGGGAIDWHLDADCVSVPRGVEIKPGGSCSANVVPTNSGSRFCAALSAPPDCLAAQRQHVTLIEPTFDTSAKCKSAKPCAYYDISVIPANCTDADWDRDHCAGTGGAAYNLPVALSCPGPVREPLFVCRGPADSPFGSHYPRICGNPAAKCIGNTQSCVMAYFHPMFSGPGSNSNHQPVGDCPDGRTLTVQFLAGP